MSSTNQLLPRIVRLRDASGYLGMDRNRFNKEVRPLLTEIPIGEQGIAFDRLELDDWVEQYISCNGRPSKHIGESLWDEKERLDYSSVKASGISTNKSMGGEFAKALELLNSKKQKVSSPKSLKSKGKQ